MGNKKNSHKKNYAVSEVLGGMFLLVIAVIAFSAIYLYLYPPGPDIEIPVKIEGYVGSDGSIILCHDGGDTLSNYQVIVRNLNGELIGSKEINNDEWKIGEKRYPLNQLEIYDFRLINETISAEVLVYTQLEGSSEQIFHGILSGKIKNGQTDQSDSSEESFLISSLKTKSTEEDLICFNDTIETEGASSYVYNWFVDNNPICYLLYPFDVNNDSVTEDYSCNKSDSPYKFNGTITNATWDSNGIIGGCYEFNGQDFIQLPYCFDKNGYIDDITLEMWIKTNSNTATISSFNRSRYLELSLKNGKIDWSTNSEGEIINTTGETLVNDDNWHHIVTSYDSTLGRKSIFVDGEIDKIETTYDINDLLGDGTKSSGLIGKSVTGDGTQTVGGKTPVFTDDFETNKGWMVIDDCSDGEWERDEPDYHHRGDPWDDYDGSGKCYLTDNGNYNSDVDGGHTYLISPSLDLTGGTDAIIEYALWYTNYEGDNPEEDMFYVHVSNDNGLTWTLVEEIGPTSSWGWTEYGFIVGEYVTPTSQVKVRFDISDLYGGSIVEGAIDDFKASTIGELTTIFTDDFETNKGWYTYDSCSDGEWERDEPENYGRGDPPEDFDGSGKCYLTDNGNENSDVDGGHTYLYSPLIDLSGYIDAQVHYSLWYINDFGSNPDNNIFKVYITDDNGGDWELIKTIGPPSSSGWKEYRFLVENYIDLTDEVKICFDVSDIGRGAVVEAGIDDFYIEGVTSEQEIIHNNYTGFIDEVKIYNRTLTPEQVYQNYLCLKDGFSDRSVIVSEETYIGDIWKCNVIPNSSFERYDEASSDPIQIISYSGGG